MTEYKTRNLTVDETSKLMRQLTISLGSHTLATEALRVIAANDCGVFKAAPNDNYSVNARERRFRRSPER